jgi:hypothetical protein
MSPTPLYRLAEGETFAQKLAGLTEVHLDGIFPMAILGRGYTSYNSQCIEDVEFLPGQVKARAVGQDVYETTLMEVDRAIFGACTCPFGGRCKHQAALLIYLIKDADKEDFKELDRPEDTAKVSPTFRTYLETLDKEELLELVLRFAPESYEQSILLKFADRETKLKAFNRGKKRIEKLFKRDLYDIKDFEESLDEIVEELRALWPHLPEELTGLFVDIIGRVSDSFEEGYLYDHYGDYNYDGLVFGAYLAEFAAGLPAALLENLLPKIWEAINGMGYTTFENFFREFLKRLPTEYSVLLKNAALTHELLFDLDLRNQKEYYEILQPVLSETEQLDLLEDLGATNEYFALKLSEYWEGKSEIDKAVQVLNEQLFSSRERPYYGYSSDRGALYEKRIELEESRFGGKETGLHCLHYLSELPSENALRFVGRIIPQKMKEFEAILEQKNPSALAIYLEKENRLAEIPPLFEKYPDRFWGYGEISPYAFFRRHKNIFQKGALQVFEHVLEQELLHTGDRHYEIVTKTLLEIRSLKDPDAFRRQLIEIKATYKRRRNLMALLKEAGL